MPRGPERMTAEQLRQHWLRNVTEDVVQADIVVGLQRLPDPPLGPWWNAINPIPGRKSPAAAGRSKLLGLRAGAPDIEVLWAGRMAYAECKRPIGGRPGPAQPRVHELIRLAGGVVAIVRSADEFFRFLAETFPEPWAALGPRPMVRPWWETT